MSNFKVENRYVAVDNVCAWPNIKRLPSGELGAFLYNRPSHGKMEGDIELWVSDDGRSPWRRRSTVTAHAPGTVRMNMAAGALSDGSLVCLASGWDLSFPHPIRTQNILSTIQVCRSKDSGGSWSRNEIPLAVGETTRFIPFGAVVEGHGLIAAAIYDCRMNNERRESRLSSSHLFIGVDGGARWEHAGVIGADRYTETDLLPTDDGWIAVARTLSNYGDPEDPHGKPWVKLIRGAPAGDAWEEQANLTLPNQHPGHLLRLKDGRVVFTCGSRIDGFFGIFARISENDGAKWSDPVVLVDDGLTPDMGYPSTIELADDRLLTAYYAKSSGAHHRYHMATVVWNV